MLGKVVHITSINSKRLSGPKNSVTLLARSMVEQGTLAEVYSVSDKESFLYNDVLVNRFTYNVLDGCGFIIFSGVYHPSYPLIAKYASIKGIPYCISPRSSLMDSSIEKSWVKKKLFLKIYGRNFLIKSRFMHFLSAEERQNSLQLNNDFFVCPNIVAKIPDKKSTKKEKLIGYLGRYDVFHKGLDRLMEAALFMRDFLITTGFSIELHGTDFGRGREFLESFVERHKLGGLVRIGEPLYGQKKADFLNRVSVFVHTSRYEGLPQAVMEAMVHGCAIAVTPGTNMRSIINDSNGGIELSNSPDLMSQQLVDFLMMSNELPSMQYNSFKYAAENFNSERVAGAMLRKLQSFS